MPDCLNRWYDAEVGRWLSEDPIGFEGEDANLYRYVGNGPTVYIDSLGLVSTSSSSGGSGSYCSSSTSASAGVSPPHQAFNAWANGASWGAIWDASPFGDIGSDATDFGNEWQKKKGGDWGNAARHGYWQAMLACKYGHDVATAIGNAHESGQECSPNPDSRVDQFNNNVARQIGLAVGKPCNAAQIRKAIGKALEQGNFITDQKNDPRIPPLPAKCKCG